MKKLNLLIAALHASALALGAAPAMVHAQDASEIQAYMSALATGTPEAMQQFLAAFPNSALPGSELGASIAAGLGKPTGAVDAPSGPSQDAGDQGIY
jgi:hypothetical protein